MVRVNFLGCFVAFEQQSVGTAVLWSRCGHLDFESCKCERLDALGNGRCFLAVNSSLHLFVTAASNACFNLRVALLMAAGGCCNLWTA